MRFISSGQVKKARPDGGILSTLQVLPTLLSVDVSVFKVFTET
ncbi:MAG: hypothetical protein R3B83_04605 [Nitrospirales bacterium]